MGSPTHLQILNPEGLLFKGNTGTKCGAETEGKATQRLPHLGIHPIYCHQTQTLLWMLLADRSLIELSPEGLYQCLTNTEVDALSQALD